MVSFFKTTREEDALIEAIFERANAKSIELGQGPLTKLSFMMDLGATHSNGCPLKLQELLEFPDFDFVHDVWGIMAYIDRKTGKLTRCFLPRCAQPRL